MLYISNTQLEIEVDFFLKECHLQQYQKPWNT